MAFKPLEIFDDLELQTHSVVLLLVIFGSLLWYAYSLFSPLFSPALRIIFFLAPIWVPLVLGIMSWRLWLEFIRAKFISKQEYVLLDIRLPREISRSPLAMETLLTNFHIGIGETTFIDRYILGKVRPWHSLEMVSLGGEIHFYIWTRKFLQKVIETQIYGQYPAVEIYEAEDYAKKLHYTPEQYGVWACDFKLTGKDAYPIKTYVDYGLDKDPKEEFKIDPMAGFFEFLGQIGPDEQIWFQILIRVNKGDLEEDRKYISAKDLRKEREEEKKDGWIFFGETRSWKEEAKKEIKKIIDDATPKYTDDTGKERPGFPNMTPGDTDKIKALERSVSKLGFDVGIRGIYIAKSDKFNPTNIVALTASLKQLNSSNLNGFSPTRWFIDFSYPWQDFRGKKKEAYRREVIDAYRRRSWFHAPYKTPSFVLNTEELATIFHFPGSVVQAPTLGRVQSTKGDAPSNLPM
ncbi:hypothetical protein HQ403_02605 [Candidatus Kaiserbacteria bacterium]|nr:hypothetical protein [Candidatus Kaiserbacteria bacterium]